MAKMIINGEVYSGSTNYASAITYIKEDGTKSTVQKELDSRPVNNNNYASDANISLENQAQPYTVQENGLLYVILTCTTIMWSYASIDINGVRRAQVQNTGSSAQAVSFSFEVYKGDILTWNTGEGGSVVSRIHYRK